MTLIPFELSPPYIIILLFLLSAIWDFQKCVAIERYGWKNINKKYLHENNWHLKTTSIWLIPLLVLSFTNPLYLSGLLIFWIEDLFYYILSYIFYRKWLPEELPWLVYWDFFLRIGGKDRFIHLPFPQFNMTRKRFLILMGIQVFLFTIFWVLVYS
jgi:hypothetical protein